MVRPTTAHDRLLVVFCLSCAVAHGCCSSDHDGSTELLKYDDHGFEFLHPDNAVVEEQRTDDDQVVVTVQIGETALSMVRVNPCTDVETETVSRDGAALMRDYYDQKGAKVSPLRRGPDREINGRLAVSVGGSATVAVFEMTFVSHTVRIDDVCILFSVSTASKNPEGDGGLVKVVLDSFQFPEPTPRSPTSWAGKPSHEWPQVVLTNSATFDGHSALRGASGFLVQGDDGNVHAATAAHLLGRAGGVEPPISVGNLAEAMDLWTMHPRTDPLQAIRVVPPVARGRDVDKWDWVLLSTENPSELPAEPLTVRPTTVRLKEKVYLVGCPYSETDCRQNVYGGKVDERWENRRFAFRLAPPVDLRGFSGAPVVDSYGHLVGVLTSGDQTFEDGRHRRAIADDTLAMVPLLEDH